MLYQLRTKLGDRGGIVIYNYDLVPFSFHNSVMNNTSNIYKYQHCKIMTYTQQNGYGCIIIDINIYFNILINII